VPIIFEDEDILVIDKPSGITVHEAPGEKDITVNEIFADKYKGDNKTDRDMIVHRLDKGTSGVMVLAKNPEAGVKLRKQFADREVQKTYIALVAGKLEDETGIIDMPLGRDQQSREKISPQVGGKPAVTEFKKVQDYDSYSLVEAYPKTGRTHQIRTHFAAIGHPVYGDVRYGSKVEDADRIFLHAARISIKHPTTGEKVTFESPLPKVLEDVLSTFVPTQ